MTILVPPIDTQRELVSECNLAIQQYFHSLNNAYRIIAEAQQKNENFILQDDAELIEIPQFGLSYQLENGQGRLAARSPARES